MVYNVAISFELTTDEPLNEVKRIARKIAKSIEISEYDINHAFVIEVEEECE
jgi:hypothetical protein